MFDDQFRPPSRFLPKIEPRFRERARRMTIRLTVPVTVIAVAMCVVTHYLADALGLLPYPIWPAVLIGSLMAGLFAAIITWIASRYVASAYFLVEAAREDFERQSRTDALTGLLNRRAFVQSFADMPETTALLLFDIDHFKSVNDWFGHGGGDLALVETSRTLAAGFTAPDVVARIGGEEFAVLIASCAGDAAVQLAERARSAIGDHSIVYGTETFSITASGGIAHVGHENGGGENDGENRGGADIDALLLAADRALYLAKAQGRDRLVDAGGSTGARPPAARRQARDTPDPSG